MESLTIEEVVSFHITLLNASNLKEDEGLGGQFSNRGNLEYVLDDSNHIIDPFKRATCILFGIATGHPFVQGNKRLAFLIAGLILLRTPEQYSFTSSPEENNCFVRAVAQGEKSKDEIELWLKSVVKSERC